MNFHIFGFLHSDGRRVRLPGRFTDEQFDALTMPYGLPDGMFCWHLDGDNDIRIPFIEKVQLEETDPAGLLAEHIRQRGTKLYVEVSRVLYTPLRVPLQIAISDRPTAFRRRLYRAASDMVNRYFPNGNGFYCLADVENFEIWATPVAAFNS